MHWASIKPDSDHAKSYGARSLETQRKTNQHPASRNGAAGFMGEMKLPLITRKSNDDNSEAYIFHVLSFKGYEAIGVNEDTLKIEVVPIGVLDVLSEDEYEEYKKNLS